MVQAREPAAKASEENQAENMPTEISPDGELPGDVLAQKEVSSVFWYYHSALYVSNISAYFGPH